MRIDEDDDVLEPPIEWQEDIPSQFLCEITRQLMRVPMTNGKIVVDATSLSCLPESSRTGFRHYPLLADQILAWHLPRRHPILEPFSSPEKPVRKSKKPFFPARTQQAFFKPCKPIHFSSDLPSLRVAFLAGSSERGLKKHFFNKIPSQIESKGQKIQIVISRLSKAEVIFICSAQREESNALPRCFYEMNEFILKNRRNRLKTVLIAVTALLEDLNLDTKHVLNYFQSFREKNTANPNTKSKITIGDYIELDPRFPQEITRLLQRAVEIRIEKEAPPSYLALP